MEVFSQTGSNEKSNVQALFHIDYCPTAALGAPLHYAKQHKNGVNDSILADKNGFSPSGTYSIYHAFHKIEGNRPNQALINEDTLDDSTTGKLWLIIKNFRMSEPQQANHFYI